ncbi:MAG: 4-demethylwyosine synthase TYW1 [archaeon]
MESKNIIKVMEKQGYRFVGDHAAVKICRWTKKAIRNEMVCYKEKFYGIKSHQCCQMSPWLGCENKCIHCWRALELDFNKIINKKEIKEPKEIIDGCIEAQRRLIGGFNIDKNSKKKQLSKADMKKFREAQEPMQFAISLSGEPTLYNQIGEFIGELRKRGKTSFLVTNGLYPEKIKELLEKKQLPTQLYVSVNSPNKTMYEKFHRSTKKNAWAKLNETLELLPLLRKKTRTVFRMNLVLNLNMNQEHAKEYALIIKKSKPLFIEIKGFMSIGFARQRLGYDRMPKFEDIFKFSKLISEELKKLGEEYKLLDTHEFSRVVVLGKDKKDLKIKGI